MVDARERTAELSSKRSAAVGDASKRGNRTASAEVRDKSGRNGAWRGSKPRIRFDEAQQRAIGLGLARRLSIVAGPPGAGKTTVCQAIANNLERVFGVALSARAARVLGDKAGVMTMTAHKFFTMRAEERFAFCRYDALIIDECSMLSSSDLRDLLATANQLDIERVILVGDPEQLQPIDEGRPFADLVEAQIAPATMLLTNYREREHGGGIAMIASDIREDMFSKDRLTNGAYPGVIGVHERDAANALEAVLSRYSALVESGAKPKDITILVPFKRPSLSLSTPRINAAIRSFLGYSPARAQAGEIVIGTRNDYERNIINGAKGVIARADRNDVAIDFEGVNAPAITKMCDMDKRVLPVNVAFGYAFTIHKAQGSEFEHVIVAIDGANDFLLRKSSLYTAVTRARSSLAIIGDLDAAEAMSRSADRRTTVLQALLGLPGPKTNTSLDWLEAGRSAALETDEEIEF
jgi:exodeoxyribonuclease V alpha subunit